MGKIYGYARVSTREQNLDRQLDALKTSGVAADNVFCDKASGADFDRPAWKRLVSKLREGDTVMVKSIDRLGRGYDEILETWRALTKDADVDIVVIDMPLLDTRAGAEGVTGRLVSDIVLQLLSYVAQVEREGIRARQAEGIAAARSRGVKLGRPRIEVPDRFPEVRGSYVAGDINRDEAAGKLGISTRTFSRWLAAS